LRGQKKRFKDNLKAAMKELHIDPAHWESQAADRAAWRTTLHKSADTYERERIATAKTKRRLIKQRLNDPSVSVLPSSLTCPHCNRNFQARIGLISHLQTHPSLPTPSHS
jgi:hypothetical protein